MMIGDRKFYQLTRRRRLYPIVCGQNRRHGLKGVRENCSFDPLGLVIIRPSPPRLAPRAGFLRRFAAETWTLAKKEQAAQDPRPECR